MQICGHDVANKRNGKQAQKPMQLQSRKSDLDADFEIHMRMGDNQRVSEI